MSGGLTSPARQIQSILKTFLVEKYVFTARFMNQIFITLAR